MRHVVTPQILTPLRVNSLDRFSPLRLWDVFNNNIFKRCNGINYGEGSTPFPLLSCEILDDVCAFTQGPQPSGEGVSCSAAGPIHHPAGSALYIPPKMKMQGRHAALFEAPAG